ncbi:hypothetical protein H9P43_001418 [Blastocladiella emersonii ATCC 22665]|nr:hypothetical protein H9P43_001418 [Blastocladiella emersonii ATCC 22665]
MDAFLHNVGASSVAALAGRLISHPFDTVKTRIQADPRITTKHFTPVLRRIYAHEGVAGLYRGLPIALAFSMPAVSTYLYVYDATKAAIGTSASTALTAQSPATHFVSAIVAELCSGLFWTPLELIKNKQQCMCSQQGAGYTILESGSTSLASTPAMSRSVSESSAIAQHAHSRTNSSAKHHHPRASFTSLAAGITPASPVPESVIDLPRSPSASNIHAAAFSSTSAAPGAGPASHASVSAIARKIYKADGLAGFFKGYWLSLTVFIPYSIVYFMVYEQTKAMYASWLGLSPALTSSPATGAPAPPPLPLHGYLVCAATSGALAAAVSNPLDRVKTIVQVSDGRLYDRSSRMLQVIRRLAREEGWWRAATCGIGSRCLWAIPNVVVSMVVYESLKVRAAAGLVDE